MRGLAPPRRCGASKPAIDGGPGRGRRWKPSPAVMNPGWPQILGPIVRRLRAQRAKGGRLGPRSAIAVITLRCQFASATPCELAELPRGWLLGADQRLAVLAADERLDPLAGDVVGICRGGLFMKYADGATSVPLSPRSRPSLRHRMASVMTPAEFGESQTSSLSSALSSTSRRWCPPSGCNTLAVLEPRHVVLRGRRGRRPDGARNRACS